MGVAHGPLRRRYSGKGRAVPERPPVDPYSSFVSLEVAGLLIFNFEVAPPVMWRCVPKKSWDEKTQRRTWAASCYGGVR
jgi:hypothetical protein